MSTVTKKKPSKAVQKKALELLQESHNQIELEGFDMGSYSIGNGGGCIIGNVRTAAGVYAEPSGGIFGGKSAEEDDGPELPLALEYLDKATLRSSLGKKWANDGEWSKKDIDEYIESYGSGRLAEEIGTKYNDRANKSFGLRIFRMAIRDLVKDM